MKKIKMITVLLVFMMASIANAQVATVKIKTSAICTQCKEKIENDLSFEKGVKSANLDVDSKIVTVIYNTKKTDEQKIRIAVTKIGYDADTLKADVKSFNKLPDCCKHEGKSH